MFSFFPANTLGSCSLIEDTRIQGYLHTHAQTDTRIKDTGIQGYLHTHTHAQSTVLQLIILVCVPILSRSTRGTSLDDFVGVATRESHRVKHIDVG